MRYEIRKLHNDLQTTTIYVTHDQIEAMTMADEIVVLNNGVIEQIGTPYEIYEKPNNTFVAGFIGSPSINFLKGGVSSNNSFILNTLEIPLNIKQLQSDSKLILGIRPIDIKIDSTSSIKVNVDLVETTGSETHLSTFLDGESFHIVVPGGKTAIRIGDELNINLDNEKIHLFDQQTKKRIN
jgi:multiple sugar transport system ATP-binding protein